MLQARSYVVESWLCVANGMLKIAIEGVVDVAVLPQTCGDGVVNRCPLHNVGRTVGRQARLMCPLCTDAADDMVDSRNARSRLACLARTSI